MSKIELAGMLERFIGDAPGCEGHNRNDFTSVKAGPELEPYRQRLLIQGNELFDTDEIRRIANELRN